MALTFTAGTPAVSSASVTTIDVPLATTTVGEYNIIAVALVAAGGTITTPAGWTDILPSTDTVTGSTSGHLAIFYRKYVGGDADPVTVTVSSGRVSACAIRVQGADLATFIDTAASVTQDPDNGSTHDAPTITTTASSVMCNVVMMRCGTNGAIFTFTPDGADAEVVDTCSTSGSTSNAGFSFNTSPATPGVATGTRTVTSSAVSQGAMGVSFAVKEASGAAAPSLWVSNVRMAAR